MLLDRVQSACKTRTAWPKPAALLRANAQGQHCFSMLRPWLTETVVGTDGV
jgi:hypothetical protein